jgi:hypothetical protein
MNKLSESRRRFLKAAGLSAGAVLLPSGTVVAESGISTQSNDSPAASSEPGSPDYTLHIKNVSYRDRAQPDHLGDHIRRAISGATASL